MTTSTQKPSRRPAKALSKPVVEAVAEPVVESVPEPAVEAKIAKPAAPVPEAVAPEPEMAMPAAITLSAVKRVVKRAPKPAVAAVSEPAAPPPVAVKPDPVIAKAATSKPVTRKPAALKLVALAKKPAKSETKHLETPAPTPKVAKPVVKAPVSVSPSPTTFLPQPVQKLVSKMTTSFKGYEDFSAMSKANLEVLKQANTVFKEGFEALSKEMLSLGKESMESATAAAKALFSAKTVKDVVELNAEFSKKSLEKMMADSTKIGELGVKLATDTFAPISAHVTKAVGKAAKPPSA